MAQRLIMFDFDGVIVDSLEATYAGAVRYLEEHGLSHLASPDAMLAMLDHNWYEGMARAGLEPDVAHALDAALMEGLKERIDDIPAVPGMPQVIDRVSRRHKVVVITSNFSWFVDRVFGRIGVHGVAAVAGADHHTSKVSKIADACARYPHTGGCCYIGDTVGDIAEAREAGVPSVAVTWGWHAEERLRAAGPDAVVHDPAELEELLTGAGPLFTAAAGVSRGAEAPGAGPGPVVAGPAGSPAAPERP